MRVTNWSTQNISLNNMNRTMKALQRIYEQTTTGKAIVRPSQDPLIASRALRFRTRLATVEQHMRNVDSGNAWMNVTEAAFMNLLRDNDSVFGRLKDELVRIANADSTVFEDKTVMIKTLENLMEQIGLEMNQTYAGRFVFSGWRTDQPPILKANQNGISHAINQTFDRKDIERTQSVQQWPIGQTGVPGVDGMHFTRNVNILKLPYADVNFGTATSPNTALTGPDYGIFKPDGTAYNVVRMNSKDAEAFTPPDDATTIHYIYDTGELVFGDRVESAFENGTTVTYEVKDLRAGDLNPSIYFDSVTQLSRFTELNRFPADEWPFSVPAVPPPGGGSIPFPVTVATPYQMTQHLTALGGQAKLAYHNVIPDSLTFEPSNLLINGTLVQLEAHFPIPIGMPADRNTLPDGMVHVDQRTGMLYMNDATAAVFSAAQPNGSPPIGVEVTFQKEQFTANDTFPNSNPIFLSVTGGDPNGTVMDPSPMHTGHFPREEQPIYYEFSPGTSIQVNSQARDIFTDKMYADLRQLIKFAESLTVNTRKELEEFYGQLYPYNSEGVREMVDNRMADEQAAIRSVLFDRVNNMIDLLDGYHVNVAREHTHLGNRMHHVGAMEVQLEEEEGNYNRLMSENEDVDMVYTMTRQSIMETAYQQGLRNIANNIQLSLLQFI